MTSVEKPSLRRVLSDASRVIRSNPLHLLALSLLFIFPVPLLNAIHTQTPQPATPLHSHYRRLISAVSDFDSDSDSEMPTFDKSQVMSQSLYGLLLLIFNLCSATSITHSIFHGFNAKTEIKLSTTLKSILTSFFPLLATQVVYLTIMVAILFGFGICMGLAYLGVTLLGFHVEPSSKAFMAAAATSVVLLLALLFYLGLKWFFIDTVVVIESKHGYAAFERSAKVVKGGRGVAILMAALFSIIQAILYAALGGGGVAVQMVAYAGLSTALSLFGLAAKTMLFLQCKAFNGEPSELPSYDKLGEVYVQVPHDVVDQV